jgi:hypothetical protein
MDLKQRRQAFLQGFNRYSAGTGLRSVSPARLFADFRISVAAIADYRIANCTDWCNIEDLVVGVCQKPRAFDGCPYVYVRHPLYVGNFLLGLGFSVMTHRWFLIGVFYNVFIFFMLRSFVRKRRCMKDSVKPMLNIQGAGVYPRFSGRGPQTGHFTWGGQATP